MSDVAHVQRICLSKSVQLWPAAPPVLGLSLGQASLSGPGLSESIGCPYSNFIQFSQRIRENSITKLYAFLLLIYTLFMT